MEQGGRNPKLGVDQKLLYDAGGRLVTDSVEERTPARGEAHHGVAVASMRQEGMRTTFSLLFLTKGYLGC
jgi:hypothetical protein